MQRQRRHKPRSSNGRTSKKPSAPRRNIERHRGRRLDDTVEQDLSDIPPREPPPLAKSHNRPESIDADSDFSRDTMRLDSAVYFGLDTLSGPDNMDLGILPAQVHKCETTVAGIAVEEQSSVIPSSNSQQDGSQCSATVQPIANVDYESPDYTCESTTFGTPSEGTSLEAFFNHDSCMCCGRPNEGHSFFGCLDADHHASWVDTIIPDFNLGLYSPTLRPILEVPPDTVSQRHTQKFMDEACPLFHFNYPESVDLSPVGEIRNNSMTDFDEESSTTASTESRMSISSLASEDWKIDESFKWEKPQLTINAQIISGQIASSKKSWACPWYKKDPLKYHGCSKYKLQRIKDVKQHTWRKHMKPDYYCPVCYMVFSTSDKRDGHVQKKDCASQPKPEFDGITQELRKDLNQMANRGKNDKEQWYAMWETIFPRETRPQSPYIGNVLETLVPLLRTIWNERRREIIHKSQRSLSEIDPEITKRIVDDFLDFLEEKSSCRDSDLDASSETSLCEIKEEESPMFGTSHDNDVVSSNLTQFSWNTTATLDG
ncbi:hypothetical protein F5B19DRAFT_434432 [Rostrohypoxylon terebratum]|nr:hypothetical protein F5B19DRAFT_434432 [Rostrohypoxylon terebratum]